MGVRFYAALDKIGRVKHRPQPIARKGLHQFQTAFRRIAVNMLFIFVQQGDAGFLGGIHHPFHAGKNFLAVFVPLSFFHIKAEHADIWDVHQFGKFQHMKELFKMRLKIFRNFDFSNGRADGGKGKTVIVQFSFDGCSHVQRTIGKIFDVYEPHFTVV